MVNCFVLLQPLILFSLISSSSITNPFNENSDIDKVIPDHFDVYDKKPQKAYHRSKPDNALAGSIETIREELSCGMKLFVCI